MEVDSISPSLPLQINYLRPAVHPPPQIDPQSPLPTPSPSRPYIYQLFADIFLPLPLLHYLPWGSCERGKLYLAFPSFSSAAPTPLPTLESSTADLPEAPLPMLVERSVDLEESFSDPLQMSAPQICPEPVEDLPPIVVPSPAALFPLLTFASPFISFFQYPLSHSGSGRSKPPNGW